MRYKFSFLLLIALLGMVLIGGLVLPHTAHAATFTVDDLGDTPDGNAGDGNCDDGGGACTLRAAIEEANASAGPDTIEFSVSGTISPGSALPPITETITIDGTTAPGFGGCRNAHAIELDGSGSGGANGLELPGGSDGSLIQGLTINRFVIGIAITSSNTNNIMCNFIGTDITGTTSIGFSNLVGIQLDSADDNGFGFGFSENVISGNTLDGVRLLNGSDTNTIRGNFIGVDINGTTDLGNGGHGILIDASNTNNIGSITGTNVISGNTGAGIQIQNGSDGNMVGPVNFIGLDTNGTAAIPNQDGIVILDASNNVVGDSGFGGGSVISGNTVNGIRIQDSAAAGAANGNIIETNRIGSDSSGSFAIPNGAEGILIDNAANNIVGGASSASRNVISGNGQTGITIASAGATGNTIEGNYIGTDAAGTADLGNTTTGIIVVASGTDILNNVISGNTGLGISTIVTATNTTIDGNLVGVDSTGLTALGNGLGGVLVQASNSTVTNNTISGNTGHGLEIGGAATNVTVRTNAIGVGTDGATALPNSGDGLRITNGSNNTIGGTGAGQGNQVANNGGVGINVVSAGSDGNALLGNELSNNGSVGIDLNADGVSANDGGDGDTSANQGQNWPNLSVAVVSGTGDTIITGSLNSTASTLFRLEFFESPTCDGTNGEGENFIGTTNITTDGGGNVTILATLVGFTATVGDVITATVTDPANNTSEFSNCVVVQLAPYSSVPTPPGPTDIGSAQVGSPVTNATALIISNVSPSLSVTINSRTLSGGDVGDFVINSPAAPFTIDPGDPDVNISITCTPTAVGLRTTQLIVDTTDPTQPVGGFVYTVECTGLPPQPTYASVPGGGSTIVIGTSNVGTPVVNATALQIDNTGGADLTVNLSVSGGQAGDFSVPGGTITITPAGAPVDVSITCTPTAVGLRTTTLTATTNDPLEPPGGFTYTLNCTGVAPDYDSTPAPASTINVGASPIGTPVTNAAVLNISNIGTGPLDVLSLTTNGGNAGDFVVNTAPFNLAAGGGPTAVSITCTPSAVGLRTTTLVIDTNDPAEPVGPPAGFTYTLNCTGQVPDYDSTPAPGATINVGASPVGTPITNATALAISNLGGAQLDVISLTTNGGDAGDFVVNTAPFNLAGGGGPTNVSITCTPTGAGVRTTTLVINTNDTTQPVGPPAGFTYTLNCTGQVPDYDSTPAPAGTINVGSSVVGTPITNTTALTVRNLGSALLDVINLSVSGGDAIDFVVNTLPFNIAVGGGAVNVSITCTPGALGLRTTTLTVDTNDTTQPAGGFTYTVQCTGTATPEPDYDSTPAPTGTIVVGTSTVSTPVTNTTALTVRNLGTAQLDVVGFSLTGANAAEFLVNTAPFNIPAGGGAVNVSISCTPGATGLRTATLTVDTNDPNEPVGPPAGFSYTLECTGTAALIPDYDSTPASPGTIVVGTSTVGTPVTNTTALSVSNLGTAQLDVVGFSLTGANAGEFLVNTAPFNIPAGGGAMNVSISCTPTAAGLRTATLTVDTNDPTEPVGPPAGFSYTLECTGTAPLVPDYDSTPAPTGTINVGTSTVGTPVTNTTALSVSNLGTAQLDVVGFSLTGANAAEFLVNTAPFNIPAGGGAVNVSISCTPTAAGLRTATLTVDTNDPTEPVGPPAGFSYTLECTGTAPLVPDYDSTPAPTGTINVGTSTVGAPITNATALSVSNLGTAQLDVVGFSLTGANAAEFLVNTAPFNIPAGGGAVNVSISCTPSATGLRTATLTVDTNDPTEPVGPPAGFVYTLNCTGTAPGTPGYNSNPAPGSTITLTTLVGTNTQTTIVVAETGSAPLVVSSVTISNTTDFTLLTAANFTINDGGASQNVTVRCNAAAAGNFSTNVVITHNATGSPATYTINCAVSAVAVPGYGSAPTPGSTINVGTALLSNLVVTNLIVGETGTSTLSVNQPVGGSITGANAADFALISGVPPFSIADGGQNVTVTIRCIPSAVGLRLATLTFTTNAPGLPTVSYTLNCTGVTTLPTATPVGPVVVTVAPTQDPATGPAMASVIEVRGLALRSGPYLGATLLGAVRPGTAYPIQARSNDEGGQYTWYLLTVGNVTAWASGRYLEVIGNVSVVPVIGTIFDQIDNAPDLGVTGVTLSFTDLRRRPSPRSQILLRLEPGTGISIIGRTRQNGGNWWFQVRVGDQVGWIPVFVDIRRGNVNTVPIR